MEKKQSTSVFYIILCYFAWGVLPAFWKLLSGIDSIYILCQRAIWSMILLFLFLCITHRLSDVRRLFQDRRTRLFCFLAGILTAINWGVYIYAVNSGHVLDGSLGYFLEPIIATIIGVCFFHEKMSKYEKITALFSVIGVGYLIFSYRMVPVIALLIGLSFALYGAVKKYIAADAAVSLFTEMIFLFPFALLFCGYSEWAGQGSLQVFHGAQFLLFPLAGLVTCVPLLLFNKGVSGVPFYLTGILMYINPTMQFLMGVCYFHETPEFSRLIAFGFIWVGIAFTLYGNIHRAHLSEM